MILGLDLGTKAGWARANGLVVVDSGTLKLAPRKAEPGHRRFLSWRNELAELTADARAVVFEDVVGHKGTRAAQIWGGYWAVLAVVCQERGLPMAGVHPMTLKKLFVGKGNASKGEMIARVRLHGYEPRDDNEADAIALAILACAGKVPCTYAA